MLLAGRRYKVPHTLLLSADEERHAVFTAKGHPVHGGAVRIRGTWRSCNEGQQVELTMVERELMDQNETAVTTQVIRLIGAEGLSRRPPAGACRLFLGPGFRLGARWNRLVKTVKTRKKRGETGKNWARYGLRSAKDGS